MKTVLEKDPVLNQRRLAMELLLKKHFKKFLKKHVNKTVHFLSVAFCSAETQLAQVV